VNHADRTSTNYGGLDIGRADDYTCLTIVNSRGEMIFIQRWRHDEWSSIIDKVAVEIIKYNAVTLIEVNNQGDVFYEMLQKKCRNLINPFVTTTKTKPIIIEQLSVAIEERAITLLDIDWLIDELDSFTYIYNPNRRAIQYSAPVGMHDDGVMSLALCVDSLKNYKQKGKYHVLRV
jgi:hypothetical protein